MDQPAHDTPERRRALRRAAARVRSWLMFRDGVGAAALVLCAAGGVLSLAETPVWWFGGSLLLAGLVLGARAFEPELRALAAFMRAPRRLLGRETTLQALGTDALCIVIVAFIGTVMMWSLVKGERPVSHDHTVHYFKAWQLHRYFLPHGKLLGWSNRMFAGYPVNYLYPPGADLWVNAVHALFFGALNFSRAYAVAFWFFHVFTGLAVYAYGRKIGGPFVGMLAGVLCLTDLSNFRMGGWEYTVEYGVWPQTLALDFGLLALCSLPEVARSRRLAPLGAFGLWTGLSIITHPIQLIVLAILLIVTALAASFAHGVRAATAVFRLLVAYALSLLVAALWLVPFLTSRSETNQMGVWWDTTWEMGKGLISLTALPGTLGYVLAFGMLATLIMLRTRRFELLLTALLALAIPAVSNSSFVDELHLPMLTSAFAKVQFVRLSTMVKPFWFVLAAYFVVSVFRHARQLVLGAHDRAGREPMSASKSAVLAASVGLLTLPVLVPAAQAFWTSHVRKTIVTESTRPLLNDRMALEQWLFHHLPGDGFYRIGVFMGHNHDLLDLATMIDRPIYKRGFTPASNFVYEMQDRDPAILDAINLRFAISKQYLPSDQFQPVAGFGRYTLFRYKRWQPQPFQILEGEGDVKVERFGDEEIVLRAAPGAHGKLRLNISYFSRWHAYRDGKPVPITLTYLQEAPEQTGFITVPLAPGRYRFAFEPSLSDRLSMPIGLFGIVLCALFIAADHRARGLLWLRRGLGAAERLLDRASEPGLRAVRLWLLVAAAALLVVLGVGLGLWRPKLELQELGAIRVARVRYDFLENIWRAHARIDYRESSQPCLREGDRLVCRDELGNLDNERYIASSPATIKEYTMVRCIRARPEQDAVVSVAFPRVPIGDAIVGYYGIERAGRLMYKRRPVQMRVMLDDRLMYDGQTQSDNKMHWFDISMRGLPRRRQTVTFSVRADNVSKRYFCFYAQMVDLK